MKIAVLQLARFGDIFISWPTLRALRRKYPDAEIHCVVRQRFAAALTGCEAVDQIWEMNTAELLAPLVHENDDLALAQVTQWLEQLGSFDQVINLSFSPASSHLSHLLVSPSGMVRGYHRHPDGSLALTDDPSAYFYAQVGIGRANRFHLGEVFAAVAEVDLDSDDWKAPPRWEIDQRWQEWRAREPALAGDYVLVHLGASQERKSFPPHKWHGVLLGLVRRQKERVILIGSTAEQTLADQALAAGGCAEVVDFLGETDFVDLIALIRGARVLLGGDSAPMHLASFTTTPCLNLSFSSVNFWETGPRTLGSRVVFAETPETLTSQRVLEEIEALLDHQSTDHPVVERTSTQPIGFQSRGSMDSAFDWTLIQALYCEGPWPLVEDRLVAAGLMTLQETLTMALEQIGHLRSPARRRVANELVGQADVAIHRIGQLVPDLRPLVNWFETERLRLGPHAELEPLIDLTEKVYRNFLNILSLYCPPTASSQEATNL